MLLYSTKAVPPAPLQHTAESQSNVVDKSVEPLDLPIPKIDLVLEGCSDFSARPAPAAPAAPAPTPSRESISAMPNAIGSSSAPFEVPLLGKALVSCEMDAEGDSDSCVYVCALGPDELPGLRAWKLKVQVGNFNECTVGLCIA